PSRAEAVRRLIDAGLSTTGNNKLKFSDGEKLIMHMLCEVYKHLKINGGIDPTFIETVLYGGHYWGLQWKYAGIFHDYEDDKKTVSEVVNVLDMWMFIESAYDKLSKEDKDCIAKLAEPFGKDVSFQGFGGNYESEHLHIAHFLINDLDRFSYFKGRDLNSHMPLMEDYRRMLMVFEPMRQTLVGGCLSTKQIVELLNAMRH
ncbi:MAG: YfbU family protein, partial [Chloroflexi bacterium]|nr:YfbU family protein [Chloroflexota bacterium]